LLTDLEEGSFHAKAIEQYFKITYILDKEEPTVDQLVSSDVYYFYNRRYPIPEKLPCKYY
jgi:hypothetical protein